MKLKKVINKVVIESGFLSFRIVTEKGRVIVYCRGWVEFLFNILAYWGRGLLRAWSMEHGHLYEEIQKLIVEFDWKIIVLLHAAIKS